MRHVVVLLAAIVSAGGCLPAGRLTDGSPATVPAPSTILPSPLVTTGSPPEFDPDLAAAMSRWAAFGQASYAYTVESSITGMATMTDRVISIEGHPERVAIQTSAFGGWGAEQITVPGMFELIRSNGGRSGIIQATYDPLVGYPATINREEPAASDGSWSMRVLDFRSAFDSSPTGGALEARLTDARAAWNRWAPSDYTYEWQQVPAGDGATTGAGWSIRHVDGVTTATPAFGDTANVGREAASIPATFDAIEAAAMRGAWVDAVFDPVLGLPVILGIDPTPASGDGFWIKITFHDILAATGRADLEVARERWAANRPARYSYVWREVGGDRHWTYRVTMKGDVATILPSGGAPVGEAATVAPRIDDLFMLIDEALANGGHVDAAYDAQLGYPTRVTIDAPGSLVVGTITIRSVVVDAGG